MVFSSLVFLFIFLPLSLALIYLNPFKRWTNALLLLISLVFYAWGEGSFVFFLLFSIAVNYFMALAIERDASPARRQAVLVAGVIFNVAVLVAFKYSAFLVQNVNAILTHLHVRPIHFSSSRLRFRLGISFFTFHELSYLFDIYRKNAKLEKNPINSALYILLFPQLIAGPIVRYHQIADQIRERTMSLDLFGQGIRRFLVGLGKKCLIANALARPVDILFSVSPNLQPSMAWWASLLYALQIYYDFSGYSDMAIGLAAMFGFRFPENFNYPYISQSITEFWTRWHISLSSWFRDYVYVPLMLQGTYTLFRDAVILLLVFVLCGLWHGAQWTFVFWGLYYGIFLALERVGFSRWIAASPRPLRHAYVALVVLLGWVLFRAKNLLVAWKHVRMMFGAQPAELLHPYFYGTVWNSQIVMIAVLALVGSTPVFRCRPASRDAATSPFLSFSTDLALLAIGFLSVLTLTAGTYNPFIYFQF